MLHGGGGARESTIVRSRPLVHGLPCDVHWTQSHGAARCRQKAQNTANGKQNCRFYWKLPVWNWSVAFQVAHSDSLPAGFGCVLFLRTPLSAGNVDFLDCHPNCTVKVIAEAVQINRLHRYSHGIPSAFHCSHSWSLMTFYLSFCRCIVLSSLERQQFSYGVDCSR